MSVDLSRIGRAPVLPDYDADWQRALRRLIEWESRRALALARECGVPTP